MAFDDTFRERRVLEPEEVYRLCRINKRAEIYDLAGFGDPMTAWSNRRAQAVGATIVPRQVYVTEAHEQHHHRVAWVYHSQPLADEIIDQHHVVCDCVDELEDGDEDLSDIVECPAVLAALEHRAAVVNATLKTQGIFDFYGKPEGKTSPKPHAITTAKALVNFIMNYEQAHPEGWVANLVSGEHQLPLLATLLRIEPFSDPAQPEVISMEQILEEMHEDGSLVLHDDGSTVSLPEAA